MRTNKMLAYKSKVGVNVHFRYVRWVSPLVTTTPVFIEQLAWQGA